MATTRRLTSDGDGAAPLGRAARGPEVQNPLPGDAATLQDERVGNVHAGSDAQLSVGGIGYSHGASAERAAIVGQDAATGANQRRARITVSGVQGEEWTVVAALRGDAARGSSDGIRADRDRARVAVGVRGVEGGGEGTDVDAAGERQGAAIGLNLGVAIECDRAGERGRTTAIAECPGAADTRTIERQWFGPRIGQGSLESQLCPGGDCRGTYRRAQSIVRGYCEYARVYQHVASEGVVSRQRQQIVARLDDIPRDRLTHHTGDASVSSVRRERGSARQRCGLERERAVRAGSGAVQHDIGPSSHTQRTERDAAYLRFIGRRPGCRNGVAQSER